MNELREIQTRLNAPKTNEAKNASGKVIYKYRSCEDILEACKPLLKELKCDITITDEVVLIGNRFYIKSTAKITNEKGDSESTSAYAREPDTLSQMNPSQVTGAASSYARKYALNGLLAIDDTKDADAVPQQPSQGAQQPSQGQDGDLTEMLNVYALPQIQQANTLADLTKIYNEWVQLQDVPAFKSALSARRKAIGQ